LGCAGEFQQELQFERVGIGCCLSWGQWLQFALTLLELLLFRS